MLHFHLSSLVNSRFLCAHFACCPVNSNLRTVFSCALGWDTGGRGHFNCILPNLNWVEFFFSQIDFLFLILQPDRRDLKSTIVLKYEEKKFKNYICRASFS